MKHFILFATAAMITEIVSFYYIAVATIFKGTNSEHKRLSRHRLLVLFYDRVPVANCYIALVDGY